jgi:hypothetical protein
MRTPVLIILLASIAFAQNATPFRQTFSEYSNGLFMSALTQAQGRPAAIRKETLKEHAIAMFKYLAGEAREGQKLVTQVSPDPEGASRGEEEFVIYVGYDSGISGGGCEFHFRHPQLRSVRILPGQ